MLPRTATALALMSIVTTACQMPGIATDGLTTTCDQSNCHITVYVTPGGGIRVDKDPLEVTKRNANIHWDIDQDIADTWTFTSDGIKFSDDPAGQFDCQRTGNGKKFICMDRNDDRKPHKYSIKLQGPKPLQLDPTIKNQG
jgi:hypothetical protein